MKFGYFDDDNKEYVITTPATPLPWINYLGNEGFFSLVSNTLGGYSFYKDAKLRRITRYRYNNVPTDSTGRNFYIKDNGVTWNPSFLPLKTELDSYSCKHGMGYTVLEGEKNGLNAKITCFVPLKKPCEINYVELENKSSEDKEIDFYSAIEWCLYNAVDDASNFQRNFNIGEVEIKGSTIYHKTEYRERRNHYAYYSVNAPIVGFETDRDSFLGQFNSWNSPEVVTSGKDKNSVAHGWAPIASHHLKIKLQKGEKKTLIFTLGYAELDNADKWESPSVINKKPAEAILAEFANDEDVKKSLNELNTYWNNLLSKFTVSTGDDKMDRMVNIWNQYQCMVTFNMSRSASYFESGMGRGMGFRDSCQDLLGFVHLIPERARERILDIAAIQMEDGSTWHQYQPLTKQGNADAGHGFNDDPLWLIACTVAYIRETGDASILDEPVVFNNKAGSEVPLMEHLRRSVNYTIKNRGPHNLPLIGRADWNDCLNLNCFSETPGESFQTCANFESGVAESVFIAGMFCLYGKEYAELCAKYGDKAEAKTILAEVAKMEEVILTNGWDGEWFLRAYDAFENKIGTNETEEAKIFIEPQGMCVMAGVGKDNGYARKALDSVKERLTTKYGTCLLSPCYTTYHKEIGEITSYPPGYKENGGIFCHNNPWVSIAETVVNNPEEAFAIYKRTCPAYLEDISEIHRTEPYVYSQMIAGVEAATFGEAKNSWLTGTAAWTFVNVSQYLLGVQPTLEGLRIAPCLPDNYDNIKIKREYRGCVYNIVVKRSNDKKLVVDGKEMTGNIIPIQTKKEVKVEIYI